MPEAARYLGIGRNTAYEAANRGELPVLRFGRTVRVRVRLLIKLLLEEESERRSSVYGTAPHGPAR